MGYNLCFSVFGQRVRSWNVTNDVANADTGGSDGVVNKLNQTVIALHAPVCLLNRDVVIICRLSCYEDQGCNRIDLIARPKVVHIVVTAKDGDRLDATKCVYFLRNCFRAENYDFQVLYSAMQTLQINMYISIGMVSGGEHRCKTRDEITDEDVHFNREAVG
ncbi:hypothetical protein GYMLUDRAFT_35283 [Collybiopsis luxurians FD-317 M1]|nr:hypothetical protein GYMLUDRAFT_35283 [Collybiopsis luxurians FD-317 M1]